MSEKGLSDGQKELVNDQTYRAILTYIKRMRDKGHEVVYFNQIARYVDVGSNSIVAAASKIVNPIENLLKARLLFTDLPESQWEKFFNEVRNGYKISHVPIFLRRRNEGLNTTAYAELEKLLYS